jgi:UDP-glucuronate 4-epimerase
MDNRNILVTGGAGFIGSNLIDQLLVSGHSVICIDNFDPFYDKKTKTENLNNAQKHPDFVFIEGDIRNQADLEKSFCLRPIDLVIHLAAKAGVRQSIDDPVSFYDVNLTGTLNVLEIMRKFGTKRMIFASSSSVYGNNPKTPFSEYDPVDNPISPYAASKKAGELLCHTYHSLFGFDIFCLRFFTVYGPRQRPDLAIHKFTNLILNNQSIPVYGNGNSARDYTYINDIVDGILKASKLLNKFDIFNLGESKAISLIEMIQILENALGKKANKNFVPIQPGDVDITFADITKAQTFLGYFPRWNFVEGIQEFLKWKFGNCNQMKPNN